MKHEVREKSWGKETWIVNREYCGKILDVDHGAKCSMHYHLEKHETFYVLYGRLKLTMWPFYDPATGEHQTWFETLHQGQSKEIPVGVPHSFEAEGPTTIIEFSTHHDDDDSYRLTQSEGGKAVKDGQR